MNVFIIPSWYPSDTNPAWGIFCKEQAEALAFCYPQHNFGISLWGQNKKANLLYSRHFLHSFKKLAAFKKKGPDIKHTERNLVEYNTPALTWNRRVWRGNILEIISANETNLRAFQNTFGKADIIHAHVGYPAGYIAYELSKSFKIPYVITEHMSPFPFRYFINKGILIPELRTSMFEASRVIAVSAALKDTIKSYGIKKTVFIPNLVNENLFFPSKLHKVHSEKFIIFFLGSMIERKGVDVFLKALQKMKNFEAIDLKIGGDGELWGQFKRLAGELGISDKIEWLGFMNREEIASTFQRSDLFVLSSRMENLPLVLLEAIACGKPIISTKCGGPEIIVNQNNGLLVEVDNSEKLSEAMDFVFENYSFYNSKTIRQDFESRFSKSVVTAQIIQTYKEVIADFH